VVAQGPGMPNVPPAKQSARPISNWWARAQLMRLPPMAAVGPLPVAQVRISPDSPLSTCDETRRGQIDYCSPATPQQPSPPFLADLGPNAREEPFRSKCNLACCGLSTFFPMGPRRMLPFRSK